MMNTIIYLLSLLLFMNCSEDDDNLYEKNQIVGNWNTFIKLSNGKETPTEFLKTYYTGIAFMDSDTFKLLENWDNDAEISSFIDVVDSKWELKNDSLFLYGQISNTPYSEYGLMESFKIKELTGDKLILIYSSGTELKLRRI